MKGFFMRSSSFRYGIFGQTMVYWYWAFQPDNSEFFVEVFI
nr:MAG TPA: hypothetical protein [Caudoviricetes sp.]